MSFFGSFFGSDQRKDIKKGYQESTGMLNQGADAARNELGQHYTEAQGYISPYLQGGAQANALLGNFLGTNGADAQRQAFESFQSDPGWQASQQAGIGALDRSAAARGGIYSGAHMKGLYDYGQKNMLDAYNQRINALSGFAGQGLQAGTAAAGLAANQGNSLGNLEFGLGQQHASNRINMGNALAQTRNIGMNNLMGVAGLALKASGVGGFGVPKIGGN